MKIQLSSIVCVVKLVHKAVLAFFVETESVMPGLIPYRSLIVAGWKTNHM